MNRTQKQCHARASHLKFGLTQVEIPLNVATATTTQPQPRSRIWTALCPTFSVALCVLALPPFAWWPLALVQWVPLIWWASQTTSKQAALGGALTGAGLGAYLYFGAAVLDVPTYLAAMFTLALALSIFCALLPRMFRDAGAFAPYALGALWAALELGLALAKLPFSLALTLTGSPALLQAAALGGATLVVALLIAMQCAVARCLLPAVRMRHVRIVLSTLLVASALTILGNAHRPVASGTLEVAAAQTDLHPFFYVHAEADHHLGLISAQRQALYKQVASTQTQLLVWPEVPFARFDLRRPVQSTALPAVAELIAGNDLDVRGRQFNAVIGIDTTGQVKSRHTKSVLLPRLENKYEPGRVPQPHHALPGKPGSLICFESAFAAPARTLSLGGAGILAIATSDAYAGPSGLAAFHGSFAILRAIETRRAVVRAANGGPSMIVDPHGRTLATSAPFTADVITARVDVMTQPSLYARHARLIELAIVALGLTPLLMTLYRGPVAPPRAVRLRVIPTGLAIAVITACLTMLQISINANTFARAHQRDGPPSLGFIDTLDTTISYAALTSNNRRDDLDAAVAGALKRFGIDQGASDVAERRSSLAAASVFQVDAQRLLRDYGLMTVPWNATRDHSIIPCVAKLNDESVVLMTNMAPTAIEIFTPAEGLYSNVPRQWFTEALRDTPTCIIGRAFPWDLPS